MNSLFYDITVMFLTVLFNSVSLTLLSNPLVQNFKQSKTHWIVSRFSFFIFFSREKSFTYLWYFLLSRHLSTEIDLLSRWRSELLFVYHIISNYILYRNRRYICKIITLKKSSIRIIETVPSNTLLYQFIDWSVESVFKM